MIAGHTNINQDESGGGGGATSGSSAFLNFTSGGTAPAANFTLTATEGTVRATIAIEFGTPGSPTPASGLGCPRTDGSFSGSQLVVFQECTEGRTTGGTSINIGVPAAVANGDVMVAVVSTDATETITEPGAWTLISEATSNGAVTVGIYSRIADSEPGSYTWNIGSNEDLYGYIMLFKGASGQGVTGFASRNNNQSPPTVNVTTLVENSLVVSLIGSDDDDIDIDPPEIVPGRTNVTADRSGAGGGATSGQAVYVNQAAIGGTGQVEFYHLANEQSRVGTLALEPIEFRFSMSDTQASVCAIQQVTLSVTDRLGNPMTNFTGTVDLSIETTIPADAIGAQWLDLDSSLNGTLTDIGDGIATYQFDAADNGVAVFDFNIPNATTVDFDLAFDDYGPTFVENSSFDPALTVDENCEFRITHNNNGGTCGLEPVTVTLVDSDGNQADFYTGTVDITLDTGTGGNFSVNTGGGVLNPDPDNDDNGAVSYTFVLGDVGQVILDYENLNAGTINFDAVDERGDGPGANDFTTDGAFDNDLILADCEIRIIVADTTRDVCSPVFVTFEIRDTAGNLITTYAGDIDLSVNGSPTGDWFIGAEPGVLDNTVGGTGNGQANYDFNGTEGGDITLEFRTITVDPALSFDVSGTADNGANLTLNGSFDPTIDIAACDLTISTPSNTGDVCRDGLTVIYTITDRDGGAATAFNGLLVLQTSGAPAIGDYELAAAAPSAGTGGYGTFDNLASNDGIATYQFDANAGDAGVLEVVYSVQTADTIQLTATSSGVTVDDSDGNVTFSDCEFRITFTDATPGDTDVCSAETVEIRLVDSGGVTVDDYTGTILLSTNTGDGTWAVSSAEGVVFDPTPEDGSASYTFVDDGPGGGADDDGVIELTFTHTASNSASVNIDIDDGTTTDPGNPGSTFDPNLAVDLCIFEISFDGGTTHNNDNMTACEIQQVTIEIYRSAGQGGGLATDYAGEVNITTSTNHGNWAIGTGNGILSDTPGDDDGAATYTFSGISDGGEVTLDFSNLNAETLSIDLVDQVGGLDGVIVESGSADPDLEVTSCFPGVSDEQCVAGNSTTITIDAQNTNPALQGRMVVMAITFEGNADVTAATFDVGGTPQAMYQIFEERIEAGTFDNNTEIWGIKESASFGEGALPTAGGTYTVDFTHTDDAPAMCVFYLTDVEQVYPTTDPTPDDGTVNGSQATNTQVASTTVTTQENNSLLMSWVGNGSGGDTYDLVSPDPPMGNLTNPPDPGSADFAYAYGVLASAAAVNVDMTWDQGGGSSPNRHTHVVAGFAPLITGPPIAVGYVPVTLFETYSGNISYRTIAASLRTTNNAGGSCNATSSASASLTLPELDETALTGYVDPVPGNQTDSTVTAAYLYWFGSGDVSGDPPYADDYDQVTFVDPSLTSTGITADEIFSIENTGGANNLNYFAAYKDVTPLVTGNGTYEVQDLDAEFGAPWSGTGACAGGWALVVVFDNPFEQLRVINLFHGFQPFQWSAFTLIPRNFRMASPDTNGEVPNGQVTHVTVEGDETIFNGDESLTMQDAPGSTDPNNYIPLVTDYNPLNAEFNGTITRPVYVIQDIDPTAGYNYKYQWDSTANGVNQSNGYEIDFPGPDAPPGAPGDELGASWGVDADTHYISGDEAVPDVDDNVLFPFASTNAEEITTRYSSGQDLVLLVSEVISVTNAPIADVEITLSETSAPYSVNSTGTYSIVVTNNGNGATSYGEATGNLTVTGEMPAGFTFAAAGDVAGTGWTCSVTLSPGAFTCNYDILSSHVGGLNQSSPSANPLNFTVQIDGPPTYFTSLNNDAKVIVRLQHNDGTCTPEADGVMPDPLGCESPEFDNVNDLQGGTVDIDDLDDKTGNNNNVDSVTTNVKGVEQI